MIFIQKNILLFFLILILFTSCSHKINLNKIFNEIKLTNDILLLSFNIKKNEAEKLSNILINHSIFLAKEYDIFLPAFFHNILVNQNIKKRGLCYHFVKDLLKELKKNKFENIDIYWVSHKKNTYFEHNALVVTGKNMDFKDGLIIDAWRNSGKLYWSKIKHDNDYTWSEDIKRSKASTLVYKYSF